MRDYSNLKTALTQRLGELEGRLRGIEDRLDDPVSKDWEDQAVEREDTEVLEDLGNAGLREMEQIRAALDRMDNGTYGDCQKCGGEIAMERLVAVPHAALCRACARG